MAGCLHAVTEKWEFRYALTDQLPSHGKCKGKITNIIRIDETWNGDPIPVFEQAYVKPR